MEIKYCVKHGETEFGKYGCKKCNYEKLDNARRKYKRLLVEYKGGKCEKCGKLIHLQCNEVESLKQHMMEHHGFEMDSLRTVFYGICSECKKTQN